MRVETTERNLYKFDELTEEAQEKVFDNFYSFNMEDWSGLVDEYFQDWAKEEAEKIGISFNCVYYSLDRGNYLVLNKPYFEDISKFLEYSGCTDTKAMIMLKEIGSRITQAKSYNALEFDTWQVDCNKVELRLDHVVNNCLYSKLQEFNDSLMEHLRKEEEYITSKDYIKEQVECNDYEFTVDGDLA